ncbi:MAG TPA: hypothetical protein PLI09_13755 [Candidatus Hydrogenedentes bacterium]|nr:hypothetical protein [Candidatus Hydrogenedentota bacterium]
MKEIRAYTKVDAGTACIGNAWLERSWSFFLGNTIGLIQKAGPVEWCRNKAPEFRLEMGAESLGIMELGYTQWSEEYMPEGVALLMDQDNEQWIFSKKTVVFHGCAGVLHGCKLYNLTGGQAAVDRVAMDILLLPETSMCSECQERHVAIQFGNQGLLVGVDENGYVEFSEAEGPRYAVVSDGPRVLEPGAAWVLPDMYIVPFSGELDQAWAAHGLFMKAVQAMKARQAEQRIAEMAALKEIERSHVNGTNN